MKEIFISWEDQLDYMESNAGASGCQCYETLRAEMHEGLRFQYGIHANFEFEEIPGEEFKTFMEWLEEEEEC